MSYDSSDYCDHENRHIETVTTNYISSDAGVSEYETEIYVCDDCNEAIDLELADPVLDRLDSDCD